MAETITYQAVRDIDGSFHTGSLVVPCPVSRQLAQQLAQAEAETILGDCESDVTGHVTAEGHDICVWQSDDEDRGVIDEDRARAGLTTWEKATAVAQMSTFEMGPDGLQMFDRNGPTSMRQLITEAEANDWQVADPITDDEAAAILDRFATTRTDDSCDGW